MALTITNTKKSCELKFDGSLTIFQAAEYHSKLLQDYAQKAETRIDLSAVDELDTAGIQLLLTLQNNSARSGGSWHVSSLSETVRSILEKLDLSDQITPLRSKC